MSDKTSNKRLKRCPFCGGEAELRQFYPFGARRIHTVIRCKNCKAESGTWKIKNTAVEHWNRRDGV